MLSANKLHGTELFPSFSASGETCHTCLELHGTVTAMTPINSCRIGLRSETKCVSDRSQEGKRQTMKSDVKNIPLPLLSFTA